MQDHTTMSKPPLGIVGAGLGGLTLGRSLLKRGIPTILYLKAKSTQPNSYGITLHASTYRPLLKLLDMDEQAFRRRVAVDGVVGGNGAIDRTLLVHPVDVGPSSFRANREKLDRLLRVGLVIRWEHALERLEEKDGVTLCMQNGQRIEHPYVVGVDGVHANTRKSLLPEVELSVLPFVAINGKRRVKREVFQQLYSPAMKDTNLIELDRNGTLLQVSINENSGDLVSISWIYSRASQGPNDTLYKPNRPVTGAEDIPEEFYEEVRLLKDLEQPFKEVFDENSMRADRVLSWLMRTSEVELPELQALAKKGVYFIGDAVHAEPILGGEGANNAIRDGLELADHIANNGMESIDEWYTEKHASWRTSLEKSKRNLAEMHGGRTSVL